MLVLTCQSAFLHLVRVYGHGLLHLNSTSFTSHFKAFRAVLSRADFPLLIPFLEQEVEKKGSFLIQQNWLFPMLRVLNFR